MTHDLERICPPSVYVLRAATAYVATQPDADLLLAILGLDGVAS